MCHDPAAEWTDLIPTSARQQWTQPHGETAQITGHPCTERRTRAEERKSSKFLVSFGFWKLDEAKNELLLVSSPQSTKSRNLVSIVPSAQAILEGSNDASVLKNLMKSAIPFSLQELQYSFPPP
ncbi:hypothetical protein GSI_04541 [Ganoderma sinense ZZ0214-1]|uniref:Uncharacterized protein n=1 Tax=Ganoderma sinense ZZ0214-1 TaxID=1077348 RepID=A0A2G8SH54_9APHY|nr:hypothetical protein GSI_04541 [Ganoderma sinense ZZ0214-1]